MSTKEETKRLLKEQSEEEKLRRDFLTSGILHTKLNLLHSKMEALHKYVRRGDSIELPNFYINGNEPEPIVFCTPELKNNEKVAKALNNLLQTVYDEFRGDLAKLEAEYKELNK